MEVVDGRASGRVDDEPGSTEVIHSLEINRLNYSDFSDTLQTRWKF